MIRFLIPLAWICSFAFGLACWAGVGLFVAWLLL